MSERQLSLRLTDTPSAIRRTLRLSGLQRLVIE
jgi:hypothetical protein